MSVKTIATQRASMGIPTGRLAVWWVLLSEIVIFGGVLVSYLMHRLAHVEWGEQAAYTNLWAGAFNTLVLLTSSLSAVLAHQAAERADGPKAALLLRCTILGGGVFLMVKAFEWTHEIREGFTITSGLFWSFYYTAAGPHRIHAFSNGRCDPGNTEAVIKELVPFMTRAFRAPPTKPPRTKRRR